MKKSVVLAVAGICLLVAGLVVTQVVVARHEDPKCDVEAVIKHQQEHAQELANFAEEAKVDLDTALATLYRTAIAYQALAVECGFADGAAVQAAHELEHASFNTDTTTTDTHTHTETDAHAHDPAAEAQTLALAQSVGDPEQGKILFNTVRPEVSFACATCHRVDSTETLVGPGLLGIAGHAHNHGAAAADSMAGMDMGGATAIPDSSSGHDHAHDVTATPDSTAGHAHDHGATATPDSMAGMNMGDATPEATAAPERTLAQTVEFLHTSIVDPSSYVMPGFPDNLMPKVYGTIFTEAELNNIIAYLLTLD